MPKSGKKKKNKGIGIDFKKVKHKVGKKLPAPQNATDTTIRSRVITLPGQSVAADRGDAPVSQKNLTLKVR
jgi:pre-rRNA-processing protein IPI1